jgi:L,D-transpeptidase YcbB
MKPVNTAVLRNWGCQCLLFVLLGFGLGNASTAFANNLPAWFVDGGPTADALEAVQILKMADADGLNPNDYSADSLAQAVNKASEAPIPAAEQATLSGVLTQAVEHFISDIHYGRVDPRDVHASFAAPSKQLNPAIYVREAVASHTLTTATRAAAPKLPLYVALRQALAKYSALENDPAFQHRLPPMPGNKIAPGQAYVGTAELAQKLMALGDMPADAKIPARYEAALVDGVKAFQSRHGLMADGVIGSGTFEQINIPMAARVRQIGLTLERLRWTPLLLGHRMIVVNVPEFVLRAYEINDGQIDIKVRMNVIVGKALDTRTPVFFEDMRFIEFSPYWNIPPSIAKAETVPKLRHNPAYFNSEGLEFVDGDGRVVATLSEANLGAVLSGKLRIRQRPGPKNALGDIKFIFPNNENIYLHHTPAPQLFKRDRRDFSHGCIRVEDPVSLARFVLQDQPEWTEQRIRDAMTSGTSKTIRLKQPLPVVIAYGTAIVKNDGKVYFFQDIYGHDKLLDVALSKKSSLTRNAPEGVQHQM